ncbi:MAG TPA: preprotein translocase subunit SecA [Candidatus Solibacter sp.]|jgi:preprotein translocase subunit SecA|nr:preprotein translocase subunit SecA [Candidatus Solibacter sp.]
MSFLLKVLGDPNDREVARHLNRVEEINALEPEMEARSDEQLRALTDELRERLSEARGAEVASSGDETIEQTDAEAAAEREKAVDAVLDEVLPEAFALVREVSRRKLGMRHFDVQMVGGIVLHQGKIAEMKTGEGKTLVATLALYLNALAGKGAHLVTVNDYLARRDAGWNGPLYAALGMTVGVIMGPPQQGPGYNQSFVYDPEYVDEAHHDERLQHLRPCSRAEAYQADITYGTNNEFGFDYLRDNMAGDLNECVQRELYYAIVDEVDSILIDEARTPLIISGGGTDSTEKYQQYARIVPRLEKETDYTVDEKTRSVALTDVGIAKVEKWTGIMNIYDFDNVEEAHQVNQALKAYAVFHRDEDYIVKDGEVVIVDEFTGRTMPGRRWSDGLHQAIEAKEGVKVQQENETRATITFQNYFRIYRKLAGMTGTAVTEAEEFHKIYNLEVVVIPTHQEMIREDNPDVIYKTEEAKYRAVVEEIADRHETGQPVLVGTTDIAKSERISRMLEKRGVPHSVLNAKFHEKEAEIVEDAGQRNTVTIATNMAGRGTDIKLGEGVTELGGLHIIGTERHESRRIDNQLRGRSGRQGDPGSTRFFISLEDELMRIFGSNMERVGRLMEEDVPLESKLVSRSIESAQSKVEGYNFDARRHVVEYDDVMNTQRQIIYSERRRILEGVDTRGNVLSFIREMIADTVPGYADARHRELWDLDGLFEHLGQIIPLPPLASVDSAALGNTPEAVIESLYDMVEQAYESLEREVGAEALRFMERWTMLHVIDQRWVAYLTTMEHLKEAIGLQGYAQKDPLVEYKNEAFSAFEQLKRDIQFEIATTIFRVRLEPAQVPPAAQPLSNIQTSGPSEAPATGVGAALGAGTAGAQGGNGAASQPARVPAAVGGGSSVAGGREAAAAAASTSHSGKVGRNDPCPCGSGKKYKRCHGR